MQHLREYLPELTGKTIFVRTNYDVPIKDGQVQDTTRIEDSLPTLRDLLENGCKLVLGAHLGRPDGQVDPEMSLQPVQALLEQYLGETVILQPTIDQAAVKNSPARIILLENLRYFPGETENDPQFAQQLADLADAYVNEAFANCHRKHASVVAITQLLPSYAGLSLEREITVLLKVRNHPESPLVLIVGGAKVETKIPLFETFKDKAEHLLAGGLIGPNLPEEYHHIPGLDIAELLPDQKDITQDAANRFADKIMHAKTVIWNGTMGVFEDENYRLGTDIIAHAIDSTDAFTVIGGGDTEAALKVLDLEANIDHISTGGGAMLDLLSDGNLVALQALDQASNAKSDN